MLDYRNNELSVKLHVCAVSFDIQNGIWVITILLSLALEARDDVNVNNTSENCSIQA